MLHDYQAQVYRIVEVDKMLVECIEADRVDPTDMDHKEVEAVADIVYRYLVVVVVAANEIVRSCKFPFQTKSRQSNLLLLVSNYTRII
jgi:hypothetical protein